MRSSIKPTAKATMLACDYTALIQSSILSFLHHNTLSTRICMQCVVDIFHFHLNSNLHSLGVYYDFWIFFSLFISFHVLICATIHIVIVLIPLYYFSVSSMWIFLSRHFSRKRASLNKSSVFWRSPPTVIFFLL